MTFVDSPASETASLAKVFLTFAALATTAGVPPQAAQMPQTVQVSIEPEGNYSFTRAIDVKFSALASTDEFQTSVAEMSALVTNMLAKHQIHPDRISTTGDGSRLLQFFKNPRVEAGVDIFPNGDVVVIIRQDGLSRIYEGASKDLQRLPALLTNAGVVA